MSALTTEANYISITVKKQTNNNRNKTTSLCEALLIDILIDGRYLMNLFIRYYSLCQVTGQVGKGERRVQRQDVPLLVNNM